MSPRKRFFLIDGLIFQWNLYLCELNNIQSHRRHIREENQHIKYISPTYQVMSSNGTSI